MDADMWIEGPSSRRRPFTVVTDRSGGHSSRPEASHPEALFISSLVGLGQWHPDRWGISAEDITAFTRTWALCEAHAAAAGRPPSVEVLARKMPTFPYTKGVDPTWAAGLLRHEADNVKLRRAMASAARELGDDDVDAARSMLSEVLDATVPRAAAWDEGLDLVLTAADSDKVRSLPVPWEPLDRVTGGIRPGDLWYVGARLNHGKSWVMAAYAATALKAGRSVHYVSLEMPSHAVAERVTRILLGSQRSSAKLLAALDSDDGDKRAGAIASAKRLMGKGRIRISDPGHVLPATPEFVARCARDSDLVLVDHVGLLTPSRGARNGATWEVVRSVSKELKQVALRTRTPIVAAAQVNREGDRGMPKTVHLAESDHLGRDADVVVMMRRTGEGVLQHVADKVRNGPKTRWFTAFEPARGRFDEITRSEAATLSQFEDDDA
jgi:replicative DNA helicase